MFGKFNNGTWFRLLVVLLLVFLSVAFTKNSAGDSWESLHQGPAGELHGSCVWYIHEWHTPGFYSQCVPETVGQSSEQIVVEFSRKSVEGNSVGSRVGNFTPDFPDKETTTTNTTTSVTTNTGGDSDGDSGGNGGEDSGGENPTKECKNKNQWKDGTVDCNAGKGNN